MLVPPLIPQFLRLVSFKFVATLACAAAMRSMQLEVMAAKKGRQQKLEQQEVERGAAVKGVEPSPKRQRKLWRMGSFCSGIAVCHRAADLIASENPGFHVTHVFACEVAPDARKVLSTDFPSVRLFGDACEDAGHMPDCDVLVAGFPCQPYSSGNRHRKGSADKRCGVVRAIVEYVKRALPRVVVLENVPGILAWGQDVLLYISTEFQASGYQMDFKTLSSDLHGGVPQRRRRLYVVAFRSPTHALEWPGQIPMRSLPSLLAEDFQSPSTRPTAPKAIEKIDKVEQQLAHLGLTTAERAHMVVNCHSQLGQLFLEKTHCLTCARGAQGGFWLLGQYRMMTVDELLRLQGIDPSSTRIASVLKARRAGFLLGNSFTLTVVARVLVSAFRCIGCALQDPVKASQSKADGRAPAAFP